MPPLRATIACLVALAAAGPAHGALVSQGALRMGADALWSAGRLGEGQVVAVLDEGFGGLDRSIALGELPPREAMTIRSFDGEGGIDGRTALGLPTQHGVRMAELVHDVAPAARLVLVNYGSEDGFAEAAAWIAAQAIPIVSHSNSFLTPPFDGSGRTARAVDAAAAAGVLWVNSAGNYAGRHWRGGAEAPAEIVVTPRAGEVIALHLSWRDPSVTAALTVRRQGADGALTTVAESALAGLTSARTAPVVADGATYRIAVRRLAGPPAELDLFSASASLGPAAVAEGSVPTPGDAAGALTVGAVRWTDVAIAPYSSRGPTVDGRAKPDLTGPTYVNSNPEWPGTAGTSAATAHVAAAAALLRQDRLARGLPAAAGDLRRQLVATARDEGARGPDGVHGAGGVRLDAEPPRLRLRVGPGPRRVVRLRASDRGTLRRLELRLDGRPLRTARRPSLRLRLPVLRRGVHRLSAHAEDMAGNRASVTRRLRAGAR